MRNYTIFYTIILLLSISCGNNKKTEIVKENIETENIAIDSSIPLTIQEVNIELDFLKNLKVVELPYRDSTNFDNHRNVRQMAENEIEQLKLKSKVPDGSEFALNYKIHFSNNFYAIVINYQLGDHELFSTLITYDNAYNIIDLLNVAYDEIAESWFRKESTIYKEHIVVEDISYTDGNPQIVKTNYKIDSNGMFVEE